MLGYDIHATPAVNISRSSSARKLKRTGWLRLSVTLTSSKDHALINAMYLMAGAQRARWPDPGFPDITKRFHSWGERVFGFPGSGNASFVICVNRAVIKVDLVRHTPSHEIRPKEDHDRALREWKEYVGKVVNEVKNCSVNR